MARLHYLVTWEADVWAWSPEGAALEAQSMVRAADSTATIFEVKGDFTDNPVGKMVDVAELNRAEVNKHEADCTAAWEN